MPKYVVEMVHQFEIDTPNIRDVMLNYTEPTFPEALVTEITKLTGKVTYFQYAESEPSEYSTCAGCLDDFETEEMTSTMIGAMLCENCAKERMPHKKVTSA